MALDDNQLLRIPGLDMTAPPNRLAPPPTQAQAWTFNAQAAQDWLDRQRKISSDQGLWDDTTGLPTGKGLLSAAQQYGSGLLMGTTAPGGGPGIRAFHGSPYDFNAFDTSKIGTGEGAQAYGHGLYFAGNEGVARSYRDTLTPTDAGFNAMDSVLRRFAGWNPAEADVKEAMTGHDVLTPLAGNPDVVNAVRRLAPDYSPSEAVTGDALRHYRTINDAIEAAAPKGSMYEVNIGADPNSMLQWDQTVGQHPPAVRDKLLDMGYGDTDRGADIYSHMSRGPAGDVGASQRLQDAGIPGISYLDAGSRGSGQGTKNHVIFDANTIDILRKYGIAGLIAGGGAATAGSQQPPAVQ